MIVMSEKDLAEGIDRATINDSASVTRTDDGTVKYAVFKSFLHNSTVNPAMMLDKSVDHRFTSTEDIREPMNDFIYHKQELFEKVIEADNY